MTDFTSWQNLGTFGGLMAVTKLLTDAAKVIFSLGGKKTLAAAIGTGVVLAVITGVALGQRQWEELLLLALNGLLVGLAASGFHDSLKRGEP